MNEQNKALSACGGGLRGWMPAAFILLGAALVGKAVVERVASAPTGPTAIQTQARKPIEQIRPGDTVYAYDFQTGQVVPRKVLKVYEHYTYDWVDVALDGSAPIRATPRHQFWVESESLWCEALDLEAGMVLRLAGGRTATVVGVSSVSLSAQEPTYNLEVEEDHNYFVGSDGVLVHNGPPNNQPGHWNYQIRNGNGDVIYVGRAGPNETIAMVYERHSSWGSGAQGKPGQRFQPPDPYSPKISRAGNDTMHIYLDPKDPSKVSEAVKRDSVLPKEAKRTYADSKRTEHSEIIDRKTYIGKDDPKNHRGNRIGGIKPEKAGQFYDGKARKYPQPYWRPLSEPGNKPNYGYKPPGC